MQLLIPLLVIPVALFLTATLNFSSHWAHRSSEQVRLDALVLSLCHHRSHFIRDEIEPLNREIKALRNIMDLEAMPCYFPTAEAQADCRRIKPQLRMKKAKADLFRRTQDTKLITYANYTQPALLKELKEQNNLTNKHGILKSAASASLSGITSDGFGAELALPKDTGFQSEKKGFRARKFQLVTGIQWPLTLVPKPNFERTHRYRLEFIPKRKVMNVKLQVEDFNQTKRLRPGDGILSQSECVIRSTRNYLVERTK